MIGTPKRNQSMPDGVLTPAFDPLRLFGAFHQYNNPDTSLPRENDWASRGIIATPDTYGRGLLSVSNKATEVNIYNMPRFLVTYQTPAMMQSRTTRRLTSKTIPLPTR